MYGWHIQQRLERIGDEGKEAVLFQVARILRPTSNVGSMFKYGCHIGCCFRGTSGSGMDVRAAGTGLGAHVGSIAKISKVTTRDFAHSEKQPGNHFL